MTESPPHPRQRPADKTAKKLRGRPFPPGNSANPTGRPRGARGKGLVLLDQLAGGAAQAIVASVIRQARHGNMRAAEIVLRRAWPEPRGRSVSLALPPLATAADAAAALAAVLNAVGRGDITPSEGNEIATLIASFSQVIEVYEIERRLAALEATAIDQ